MEYNGDDCPYCSGKMRLVMDARREGTLTEIYQCVICNHLIGVIGNV